MLQARSSCLDARKKSDDLTTATVPAGTTFPAVSRDPCDLLMRATRQPSSSTTLNSVPSIHMRCKMTASLRATATLALRSPLRLASLAPQAFSRRPFRHAGQQHAGCFKQIHAQHGVTALRDSAGPIDLPRGVASGRQSDIGPDTSRSLEARRIVDCRLEAERGDRADTRYGHKPTDLQIMTRQLVNLTVEIVDLLLDGLARRKQRSRLQR